MQYVGKRPRHRDRNDMLVKQKFLFFFLAMQVCSFTDLLLTAAPRCRHYKPPKPTSLLHDH